MVEPQYFWLFLFIGLYFGFCFFFTLLKNMSVFENGYSLERDYNCGYWSSILTSSGLCFSAWCFLGQPALIYHGGSGYGFIALASITIPFAGILFFKRQILLCSHFGFLSPLELYGSYFQSAALRLLILSASLVLIVGCFGLLLLSTGTFIHHVFDETISPVYGMIGFCLLIVLHFSFGQYRTFLSIVSFQFFLFVVGVMCLSLIIFMLGGGIDGFISELAISSSREAPLIQIDLFGSQDIKGIEAWSFPSNHFLSFTFLISLMGLQMSPLFSMLALQTRDANAIAHGQVWFSGCLFGGLLIVVSIFIGQGAQIAQLASAQSLGSSQSIDHYLNFIPQLLKHIQAVSPFLFGFISLSVFAALHMTAALLLNLLSNLIALDLRKASIFTTRFGQETNSSTAHFLSALLCILLALITLVLVSKFPNDFLPMATLGIGFSFQMVPALIGVCFVPWFTGRAILAGLIAGLIVVLLTDQTNGAISDILGTQLPFGSHPYSIYSAVWGALVNFMFVILVSSFTQNRNGLERRAEFHHFLETYFKNQTPRPFLLPFAWSVTFVWFFFAIGPGTSFQSAFLAFDLFGSRLLSFWVWIGFWWAFGVFMLWLWAYPLQLSRFSGKSSFLSRLF
jgi:Na+/proline symporter